MTRRYTDREVRLIIQRALESTAGETSPDLDSPGLSLEQVKGIAAEVGIDPGRIELAAANLLEPSIAPANPYAGIPTTVQFQTTLPGMEAGEVSRHDMVALIRSTLGRQGIVTNESGSLEWKARDAFGGRYVSLAPAREGAQLRVLGNYRDGLTGFVAVVGMTVFATAAAILSGADLGPAITLLAAATAAFLPPRFAYRWWRKKEDARMADLHGRLVALLSASATSDAAENRELPPDETPADQPL
jgi:hypothetical protein